MKEDNVNEVASTTNKPLYGLILAGGMSSRMGRDKATLQYHGKPHWEFLYELVQQYCDHSFISIREEQRADIHDDVPYIIDNNDYRGPFNGILSAHSEYPNAAWLVIACDLPLLDTKTIELLVRNRDVNNVATALATKKSGLPEPLAAIWEPEGLKKAISYLRETDSSCPRKFLIKSNCMLIYPENDAVLTNANSLEEYKQVTADLKQK